MRKGVGYEMDFVVQIRAGVDTTHCRLPSELLHVKSLTTLYFYEFFAGNSKTVVQRW